MVNWDGINDELPVSNSKNDRSRRLKMFRKFDPDGNGFLSLSEVTAAIYKVLYKHLGNNQDDEDTLDLKPAIEKAFLIAKVSKPSKRGDKAEANENIEISEFKFFLLSLRQYFEYYVAFVRVDTNSDQQITLDEFKSAQDRIESWVGKIDANKCFKKIDKNNSGSIQFDEFCNWAIKKNLDLEVADSNISE